MFSKAWRICSQADIFCHVQTLISGILHFPSLSLSSVSLSQAELRPWCFHENNAILTFQPTLHQQWRNALAGWGEGGGGGLSFTLPLTPFLPRDPAPTSFQHRIKELLTEGATWLTRYGFLPCQKGLLCLSDPRLPRTHISHSCVTWTTSEFLCFWNAKKGKSTEPGFFTRFVQKYGSCTPANYRRSVMCKDVTLCVWHGRCLCVQCSSVQQQPQSAAELCSFGGTCGQLRPF